MSLGLAFIMGAISFLSPCTLPLFPSYLGYITGMSVIDLKQGGALKQGGTQNREMHLRAVTHAFAFCLGLSVLFVMLGYGATALGELLAEYRELVRLVGGVFVIVMGLFMAGVIRSGWLMRERRFLPTKKPMGYGGSFLVGVAFAFGWTPCIGPTLSAVLGLVMNNPEQGTWYMVAYALGFSLPFLLFAVALSFVRPLLKYTEVISKVGGWLLVLMGVLLLTDKMAWITIWLQKVTGYSGF